MRARPIRRRAVPAQLPRLRAHVSAPRDAAGGSRQRHSSDNMSSSSSSSSSSSTTTTNDNDDHDNDNTNDT